MQNALSLATTRTQNGRLNTRSDHYFWRLAGTAFSFAAFGFVGLLMGALLAPLLRILVWRADKRKKLAVATVAACFRSFIRLMRGLGVLSYEFEGREGLGRAGQLIVANHPSLIDVVFLLGFSGGAGCVVKAGLWRSPFTAGVVSSAGYIPNEPTATMIESAVEALRTDHTLIMFPEGTRSTPGSPLKFHRGAAAVGVKGARVVTPVYITVSPTTLTKHQPWYRIPSTKPHFRLTVGKDLDPQTFRSLGADPLAARALNAALLGRYEQPTDFQGHSLSRR